MVRVAGLKRRIATGVATPVRLRAPAARGAGDDLGPLARAHGPARRLLPRGRRSRPRRGGHPPGPLGRTRREGTGPSLHAVPAPDLPRADPAGGRPRAPLPVHLRPVAEPGRRRTQPRHRPQALRPGQGPPAALALPGELPPAATCPSRTSSRPIWRSCSRAWRCWSTTPSGSPATRTWRSRRTTPRTSSRPWRRSSCGAASGRLCAWRSRSPSTARCSTCWCGS